MLTEAQVKNTKPRDKRYMLRDEHNLYLEVLPNGTKAWRFRYWADGKERKTSFGKYPLISLKEARERRDKARVSLMDGISPTAAPKAAMDFGDVFEEWLNTKVTPVMSPAYAEDVAARVRNHALYWLGKRPITEISSQDLLCVLRRVEASGHVHMAHRLHQICGQVFRYAVAAGFCENDPSAGLKGALQPHTAKHRASITSPAEIGPLLRAIGAYPQAIVRCAMQFSALTFLRPGEVRHTEWAEIVGDELRIPGEKMKMKRQHVVPLARQTIELLQKTRQLTGHGRYVFPNSRTPDGSRPMSEAAVLVALRSMGYTKDQMVPHGFRSMASTLLNENGFNRDWIERQLAHIEGNSVRAAYNYADYLPERRKMMQWWSDYLDELKG